MAENTGEKKDFEFYGVQWRRDNVSGIVHVSYEVSKQLNWKLEHFVLRER